jgi:ABC-type amino acid transport substrate-binding protein
MQSFVKGKASGYSVDIISEIAKRTGCKVFFSEIPWARQFVEVASGKLDVVLGGGKRPEREKILHYGRPDINGPSVIIFNKEDKNFKSFKLNQIIKLNLIIGAKIGAQYSDEYTILMKDPEFSSKIELSINGENLVKKFKAKRIDGILFGGILTAKTYLKDEFKKNNLIIFPLLENDYSYISYSKKRFTIENAKALDKELKKIINDGTQFKIMKKYFSDAEIKSLLTGIN